MRACKVLGSHAPATAVVAVITDVDSTRTALSAALAAAGHEVVSARTLASARALFDFVNVEVVLVDVSMQEGNGRELVVELVTKPGERPAVLVLADQNDGITKNAFLGIGVLALFDRHVAAAEVTDTIATHLKELELCRSIPRPNVLIVDDDKAVAQTIARILERAGIEVSIASDAVQAHAHVASGRITAAVVDVCLQDANGLDFCQELRQDHKHADLPIFLFTGLPSEDAFKRAMALGVVDFLPKPIGRHELITRLAEHVPMPKASKRGNSDRLRYAPRPAVACLS